MPEDRIAPPLPPPPLPAAHTTRRAFLATAGLATAAAATLPPALAASLLPTGARDGSSPALPSLLCSLPDNTVALLRAGTPRLLSRLQTPAPRAHAAHPTLPITYVANASAEHAHLPRGAVSAVHFDPRSRTLTACATEPLALHSTRPERLAISPSGQHLVVLSAHSGSLTLLPLSLDGSLQAVTHTIRLPGRGPLASQGRSAPCAAIFHPSAPLVYVIDRGTDSLLTFHLVAPPHLPASLALLHRRPLPPGFAPAELALTPTSLVLASSTSATLLALPLDAHRLPSAPLTLHPLPGTTAGPILFEPRTGTLLAITYDSDTTTRLAELGPALTPHRTKTIPALTSVAQLVLRDRTLLLAGSPHLLAINLDALDNFDSFDDLNGTHSPNRSNGSPAHTPRVLLANQATLGISVLRSA